MVDYALIAGGRPEKKHSYACRGGLATNIRMSSFRSALLIGLCVLGVTALGLRLAFFGISVARVPASSDETLSTLQAKMMIEEGRWPLLVMANPYQFPVESYLQVPLVKLLPRTALGARGMPFLLSLAATAVFIVVLFSLAPLRTAWPALLLLLFPSAYVLMLSSAYFIPQHSSFTLLSSLALCLAFGMRTAPRPGWIALLSGFCAGLAFSNHMLALPLLVVLGAYAVFSPRASYRLHWIPVFFFAGVILGLIPYLLAIWLLPGAHGGVMGTVSLGEALRRIWGLTLNSALSGVMGISPCLFPDGRHRLWHVSALNMVFAVVWLAVMAAMTALRAWRCGHRIIETGRVTLEANDALLGLAWLGFGFFLLSTRSLSHTYRYLLPVAWTFPFLVSYLYARSARGVRILIGSAAILLAGFNIVASLALMRAWLAPEFAVKEADLFDLKPAIDYLESRDIRHACASYWLAYRLTYETDGRLTCSQPYNERFPGWFTPYKQTVDAAKKVAYLTVPRSKFPTKYFEQDLVTMGVSGQREVFGQISVYTDFHRTLGRPGNSMAPNSIHATASHNGSRASRLVDGNFLTSWQTQEPQQARMWIQLDLKEPATLTAVAITYSPATRGPARSFGIMSRTEAGWQDVAGRTVTHALDRFDFRNGHPVYGRQTQTFDFPAVKTISLRLIIREPDPDPDCAWAISEIKLYGTTNKKLF